MKKAKLNKQAKAAKAEEKRSQTAVVLEKREGANTNRRTRSQSFVGEDQRAKKRRELDAAKKAVEHQNLKDDFEKLKSENEAMQIPVNEHALYYSSLFIGATVHIIWLVLLVVKG